MEFIFFLMPFNMPKDNIVLLSRSILVKSWNSSIVLYIGQFRKYNTAVKWMFIFTTQLFTFCFNIADLVGKAFRYSHHQWKNICKWLNVDDIVTLNENIFTNDEFFKFIYRQWRTNKSFFWKYLDFFVAYF